MKIQEQIIQDFGVQWTRYQDSPGYYGSLDFLADVLGPLIALPDLQGKKVAEIGSGTGRIVSMLLQAGAAHVTAVEPSRGFDVLVEHLKSYKDKVSFLNVEGDKIPQTNDNDYIFSIGVIHHIPQPEKVLKAIHGALRPGGKFFMWVYGKENNGRYLSLAKFLRPLTTKLPHFVLVGITWILFFFLKVYMQAAKVLPLPLKDYLEGVLGKCSDHVIRLVIYDQLNPAYAKYYTKDEVVDLLNGGGLIDIKLYHRHNYSWSGVGRKP